MKTGHLYQQILDEHRCDISRAMLRTEKRARKTMKRLQTGPRAESLIVLLVALQKLRRAHELSCPGCGGQ